MSGAPGFERAVEVQPGEVVEREGFVYADLLPLAAAETGGAATRGPAQERS